MHDECPSSNSAVQPDIVNLTARRPSNFVCRHDRGGAGNRRGGLIVWGRGEPPARSRRGGGAGTARLLLRAPRCGRRRSAARAPLLDISQPQTRPPCRGGQQQRRRRSRHLPAAGPDPRRHPLWRRAPLWGGALCVAAAPCYERGWRGRGTRGVVSQRSAASCGGRGAPKGRTRTLCCDGGRFR